MSRFVWSLLALTPALWAQLLEQFWPPVLVPPPISEGQFREFTIPTGFEGELQLQIEGGDGARQQSGAFLFSASGPGARTNAIVGVGDRGLDSDGDGAFDWEELANAAGPDDAADFPVPEPAFLAQLVIGGAFMAGALRLGPGKRRVRRLRLAGRSRRS